MTASPHPERLQLVRLTGLNTVLPPGSPCTPAVAGLPALADPDALAVSWSVLDCQGSRLAPGVAYAAPAGLSGPRLDVVFQPEVVEAGAEPPAPLLRTVRATVTLRDTRRPGRPVTVTRVLAATVQVLPLRLRAAA
jgi:hypothetical protein